MENVYQKKNQKIDLNGELATSYMTKQENFTKAFKWIQELRNRYLHTIATFTIYEEFQKIAAPNIVGKKRAQKNVHTFSRHLYFFAPLKESARCYFFIELAKFFDRNKRGQSLTLETLLDLVENHPSSFSKEEFLKYHVGRYIIPELFESYKEFSGKDINNLKKRLKRNKKIIEDLKTYRDKFLVHADINKKKVKITGKQIKILLKIIRDTIDLFYQKLDFASNAYSNYDEEPAKAVNNLIKVLQEHETERLRKIDQEYGLSGASRI